MSETIYTEVTGTTCYVNDERGKVVHLLRHNAASLPYAALVRLAEREVMLLVTLGGSCGDRNQHHYVIGSMEIDRDGFDLHTGLARVRREMGWDL